MLGHAGLLSLAVAVLVGAVAIYRRYYGDAVFADGVRPAHYWCTVVGVEEGTGVDQLQARLLPSLHSGRLLAVRQLRSTSSFANSLGLSLPPLL